MRAALSTVVLLSLLALPASADPEARTAEAAVPPVKILMLDGCIHSQVEQEVARLITAVPIEIDSSAMNLDICDIDTAKANAAILSLAKRLEGERKGKKKPITLVYTGAFLQGPGVAGAWGKSLKRLAKAGLIISPGGNDPALDASEVWPSGQYAFKVGYGPGGAPTGTQGTAISLYADYGPPIPVDVDGSRFNAGGSSTAAMVLSAHLANVLASGAGRKLTPDQLLKKLKAAFKEEVVMAVDLEERLLTALR